MSRLITFAFVCYYCASSWNGLRANENANIVREFCLQDHRFVEHLIQRDNVSPSNKILRNNAFAHLVSLISFIQDYEVNVIIRKGQDKQIADTFFSIENNNKDNIINAIINVDQAGNFANAYFSIYRELIIARKMLNNFHSGKISPACSHQEFIEIYRREYDNAIISLQEGFDLFFLKWLEAEGISLPARSWLNRELSQTSKHSKEIPKIVKSRADILFMSYKTSLGTGVAPP